MSDGSELHTIWSWLLFTPCPYHAVAHHHHLLAHELHVGGDVDVVDVVPGCAGVLVAGGVDGAHVTC